MSIRDLLTGRAAARAVLPPPEPPIAPPVAWPVTPLTVARYWRCRDCDVTWQGTEAACWCCGRNVLATREE